MRRHRRRRRGAGVRIIPTSRHTPNDGLLLIYEVRYHTDFRGLRRMASRQQVLTELARHIVRLSPDRIIRVAVDGVDGAGKTTFANELADAICPLRRSVIRASVDGFHNPRAIRYERGRHSPDGYFENSYNYAALKQYLLDPLSPGGCRRYRAAVFDHVTDRPVSFDEREALPASILLFDGIFLQDRKSVV